MKFHKNKIRVTVFRGCEYIVVVDRFLVDFFQNEGWTAGIHLGDLILLRSGFGQRVMMLDFSANDIDCLNTEGVKGRLKKLI